MDDGLTNTAIENVLKMDQFGAGDDEKAKSLYKIGDNDCNDYTEAVFSEYKSLWTADQADQNSDDKGFDVDTAWDNHYKDLTKRSGEYVDFTPKKPEGSDDSEK